MTSKELNNMINQYVDTASIQTIKSLQQFSEINKMLNDSDVEEKNKDSFRSFLKGRKKY